MAFCQQSPHLKEVWDYKSQELEVYFMTEEESTLQYKLCEHNMIRRRGESLDVQNHLRKLKRLLV